MKKHMPGFVPIEYKKTGKLLLIAGLVCLLLKLISYLTGWFNLSNIIFYLGVGLILISLYLIFIVPKE